MGSTNPHIPIDKNYPEDKLRFATEVGIGIYNHDGDQCNMHDDIPTASWQQSLVTKLVMVILRISDVDGNMGQDGDDAAAAKQ
jgi:hypothetical protein